MTSQQREKIIELSDELLTFLLDYRKEHPDFRFWLRSREHNKAGDQQRLAHGQWFQGSDYIFLSFHSASGHVNMTRSIGWVVEVDETLTPHYHLSIVWPTEKDQRKIDLYKAIIEKLVGFYRITDTKYRKDLPDENIFDSLRTFLDVTLPQINQIIQEHGLTDVFTIPEEKFRMRIDKILQFRQRPISNTKSSAMETKERSSNTTTHQSFLNTILFGPPGTGKTYHTVDKALQIIDPQFYNSNKANRPALTEKFRSLLIDEWDESKGQIAFVTFHQSMSYEDFVEGIKPTIRPDVTSNIQYEIADGIFKKLCTKASRTREFKATVDGDRKLLTKELFEEFYYSFSRELPDHSENTSPVTFKTKEGYPFDLFKNGVDSIIVKAGEKRTGQNVSFKELWAVLSENKTPTYKSYEHIIIDKLLEGKSFETSAVENPQLKFVLIIDEINRGNVSQIFGELITLIEEGKRRGQPEELTVTLPYSKQALSVPSNLYIIGTMNTADRSVEALDTALRRRFSFEEILPDPKILSPKQMLLFFWNRPEHIELYDEWYDEPYKSKTDKFYKLIGLTRDQESLILEQEFETGRGIWQIKDLDILGIEKLSGINLQKLLEAINKRLEKLLSKDHQIGHAFFINAFSIEDLYDAFYQKLIPQLQEYFYGDFGKIGLVLGGDFIKSSETNDKVSFAKFNYEDAESLLEKRIYRIEDFIKEGAVSYDEFLSSVKNIYK